MKNSQYLAIYEGIGSFINIAKDVNLSSKDSPESTKVDIKFVKAPTKIPPVILIGLVKNKINLKPVNEEMNALQEILLDKFKSKEKVDGKLVDLSLLDSDKEYAGKVNSAFLRYFYSSKEYKEFMDASSDFQIEKVKISYSVEAKPGVIDMNEVDPKQLFDLSYVPDVLLGTIIDVV